MTQGDRVLPRITEANAGFWTSGADGILRILRCSDCRYWVHPPRPLCPHCRRSTLSWTATAGRAELFTYTVNRKAWHPDVPVPYVIAIVELAEQRGLRLTTNVVNAEPGQLRIGMPLQVTFVEQDGVFIPLFEPAPA